MKEVYIAETDYDRLLDFLNILNRTDPNCSLMIEHPITLLRLKHLRLKEILAKTHSGSLDLIVLPLHLSEESRRAAESSEGSYATELDGVKLGLRYREEGYKGDVLLTLSEYFPFSLEQDVERSCGFIWAPDRNYERSYLNLYSTQMAERAKVQILSHLLKGEPKIDFVVIHA